MDRIKLRITVMAVLAVFLLKGTDTFAQQTDPTLTGAVFAQTSTLKNIYDKRQKAHEKIIAAMAVPFRLLPTDLSSRLQF